MTASNSSLPVRHNASGEVRAADLIADRRCTPQCMVAADADPNGKCRCRCKGAYHGALGDTPIAIPVPALPWYEGRHGYGRPILSGIRDLTGPLLRYKLAYRAAHENDRPLIAILRRRGTWNLICELNTCSRRWEISREANDILLIACSFLRGIGHAREFFAAEDSQQWLIYGLESEKEARILGCAFRESIFGNSGGARRLAHGLSFDALNKPCECPDHIHRRQLIHGT